MTATATAGHAGVAALEIEGLTKTFPGQRVLRDVALTLRTGEIRALLGENGSGKSTLIKIVAGYHLPDPGWRASVKGATFELGSAASARSKRIEFVHQDLGLVKSFSVLDNLALGSSSDRGYWLSPRREAPRAKALLASLGIEVDVLAAVSSLTPAEQTMVAIARALREEDATEILVLDEPTATLSRREVEKLFDVMRRIRAAGSAILYVTHRVEDVFEIADAVTVLRDGNVVCDAPVSELTTQRVVDAVVGGALSEISPAGRSARRTCALRVRDLYGGRLGGVSLEVGRGEVVGAAGLEGSGREDLPYLLYGAQAWVSGVVEIDSHVLSEMNSRVAMSRGMGFVGHRDKGSAIPALSVRENVTLPQIPASRRARWLTYRKERNDVSRWLAKLDVRPRDPDRALSSLSGGNQQKVVLARCLRCEPKVVIVADPTRGVDIGAKSQIYRIILEAAEAGTSFLVASADAEELAAICQRVVVFRNGRVASILEGDALSEDNIVRESLGTSAEEGASK